MALQLWKRGHYLNSIRAAVIEANHTLPKITPRLNLETKDAAGGEMLLRYDKEPACCLTLPALSRSCRCFLAMPQVSKTVSWRDLTAEDYFSWETTTTPGTCSAVVQRRRRSSPELLNAVMRPSLITPCLRETKSITRLCFQWLHNNSMAKTHQSISSLLHNEQD